MATCMQFSTSVSQINFQSSVRFHVIREGETLTSVANKYNADLSRVISDNPDIVDQPGTMVVINASNLSKSSV